MYRITFFLLLFLANGLNAQSITIYGKITDTAKEPIPGATILLIGQQDSILKSFAVSDKNGNFIIKNVKPTTYLFKANFYGFQSYENLFTVKENANDSVLTTIILEPKKLNVITVDADYIPIRFMGDTIEYDSRAFAIGEHDVVEDLLEQLPGVEIQPDGSIKVQGKTVEKILIDGEEFFGNDPTIATKNLPADAIKKVQVFDKNSDMSDFTGVEEDDKTTTINLTLKEDRKKGYFGKMEAGYGDQNRYKAKGNVHYFKGKWQVSGIGISNNVNEAGFSMNDYIAFMGGIQNLLNGNSGSFNLNPDQSFLRSMDQEQGFLETNAIGLNINFKLSKKASFSSNVFLNTFNKSFDKKIERNVFLQDSSLFSIHKTIDNDFSFNNRVSIHFKQEFDSTHYLKTKFSGYWTNSKYTSNGNLTQFANTTLFKNQFIRNLEQDVIKYNGDLSIHYRKKFSKKGQFTGGGFSYAMNNINTDAALQYFIFQNDTNNAPIKINQSQNDLQDSYTIQANWMFSQPIAKKQLIEIELLQNRSKDEREKEVRDKIAFDNFTPNESLSGNATYFQISNNVILSHKYRSKKFKTTIGASMNNLNLISPSLFESNMKKRKYKYIMPFFNLNWKLSKSNTLKLKYKTKVNTPTLKQFQPIPENTNASTLILGNRDLIPSYSHHFSLDYNIFKEYNFTHFMVFLTAIRTNNKINYSQAIDTDYNRIYIPENNGIEDQLSSYISYGTTLNAIKTKFSITNTSSLSKGQIKINENQNKYTSFYTRSKFTIENTKKKILNVQTGIETVYSKNIYKENPLFNSAFFSWNYFASATVKIKHKWVFKSTITHHFYPNFAQQEQVILDASIARNILKSKKLQIYVAAHDLLNQNTGINQTYYLNYYEQEKIQTLARYFMVGLKYSFNKLGKK